VPIPKILAWNARRGTNNRVGSEYIIMEKAPGVALSQLWGELDFRQKVSIIDQLVGYEKQFETCDFPASGSLYYSEDLKNGGIKVANTSFAVGPIVSRQWFDEGRGQIDVYRGPCMWFP
jgi:hypothetical protein